MQELPFLLHSSSIGITVGLTALSIGIGGGWASSASIAAINTAPNAQAEINRTIIIGLALIETSGILGVFMAFLLLQSPIYTIPQALAELGITCALSISGLFVGILSALPARQAVLAIARQPFFSTKIINIMLLCQSIIQTPLIFAFLISLFIKSQIASVETLEQGIRLFAAGICIGLGSIGPIIGQAQFAKYACYSLGINRDSYGKLLPFTFISQAIIETPVIFALVCAFFIISAPLSPNNTVYSCVVILMAALCMGLGTLSPGINSGKVASSACQQISNNPITYSEISKISILAQGLIDTAAIYVFITAIFLIIFK